MQVASSYWQKGPGRLGRAFFYIESKDIYLSRRTRITDERPGTLIL
jgi:hypothetical protein